MTHNTIANIFCGVNGGIKSAMILSKKEGLIWEGMTGSNGFTGVESIGGAMFVGSDGTVGSMKLTIV
jgi:hypothetical protein